MNTNQSMKRSNTTIEDGEERIARITHRLSSILHPLSSLVLCAVALTLGATNVSAQTVLKENDRIAICGDSITEQKQYSVFMEAYLRLCQPTKVSTIQFGWSGETSWGFEPRMAHDVLWWKPTVATLCYGMNDGGYAPLDDARAKKYHDAMESIVKQFKEAGARVIIGSPGVVDSFTFKKDPKLAAMYNDNLSKLGAIGKQLAEENGLPFADVHGAMLSAMVKAKEKFGQEYPLAGNDGVHPAANGHLVMAYAFLKAMGVDGNIAQIKVNLADGKTTATDGTTVDHFFGDTLKLTSSRYPFCFSGADLKDPASTRGVVGCTPFNDELNRYMLIVTGAKTDKVKITWGNESKVFAASDLERGINLAAEFMDNPFSEQFELVVKALRDKQGFETMAYKSLISALRQISDEDSEKAAEKVIIEGSLQKWNDRVAAVDAAIVPITHTIKIEEVK